MASNSVGFLSHKLSVSSASKSTNDKEDFIKERLRRLEIAYATMAKYPEILNEYISAVKGPGKNPAEETTAAPVLKNRNVLSNSNT